jgi:hypothetical protein
MLKSARNGVRLVVAGALLGAASWCGAASTSHYAPSIFNIRDYLVPEAGMYGAIYNGYYNSSAFKDHNGNTVTSLTVPTKGGPVTLDTSVNLHMYAPIPMFIYSSSWTILGARWAGLIAPALGNSSIGAQVSSVGGLGGAGSAGSFGFGDLLIYPLWLGWKGSHYAAAFSYGIWAPTGKYKTVSKTFPGGITVNGTSPDNIGLGFWTHQFQQAGAWYPMEDQGTAVVVAMTEEIDTKKRGLNVTPGSIVTLNYGISQYLPLKDEQTLLEVGPAGFFQWQISSDTGSDAVNGSEHSYVAGIGLQFGATFVPQALVVNSKYFSEFSADSRISGQWVTLSIGKKF